VGEEKCAPSSETSLGLSQWAILKMSLTKVGCTRHVFMISGVSPLIIRTQVY